MVPGGLTGLAVPRGLVWLRVPEGFTGLAVPRVSQGWRCPEIPWALGPHGADGSSGLPGARSASRTRAPSLSLCCVYLMSPTRLPRARPMGPTSHNPSFSGALAGIITANAPLNPESTSNGAAKPHGPSLSALSSPARHFQPPAPHTPRAPRAPHKPLGPHEPRAPREPSRLTSPHTSKVSRGWNTSLGPNTSHCRASRTSRHHSGTRTLLPPLRALTSSRAALAPVAYLSPQSPFLNNRFLIDNRLLGQ
jgi:hypothetical protein